MPSEQISNYDINQHLLTDEKCLIPTHLMYVKETKTMFWWDDGIGVFKEIHHWDNRVESYIYDYCNTRLGIKKTFSSGNIYNQHTDYIKTRIPLYEKIALNKSKASNYIVLDDCVINMNTLEVEDKPEKPSATYKPVHHLPYTKEEYLTQTPTRFLQYLDEVIVFEGGGVDKSTQAFLQAMTGYLLDITIAQEASFFLMGNGQNGKSMYINILNDLFPLSLRSTSTLEDLTKNRFGGSNLANKRVNVVDEDESEKINSGKLKALVTGSFMNVERKHQDSFSYAPHVKFVFSLNHTSRFDRIDRGLTRRIFNIPFYRTILESEKDYELPKKLKAEMPGILRWAIEGRKMINEKGSLLAMASDQVNDEQKKMSMTVSSAIAFIMENFEVSKSEQYYFASSQLYDWYKSWSFHEGKMAVGLRRFKDETSNYFFPNQKKRDNRRHIQGKRVRVLFYKIKNDAPFLEDLNYDLHKIIEHQGSSSQEQTNMPIKQQKYESMPF